MKINSIQLSALAYKFTQLAMGFALLLIIANTTTSELQGYMYLLLSALNMQVLFELGLSGIIINQLSSATSNHKKKILEGVAIYLYSIIAITYFFVVYIFNTYILKDEGLYSWRLQYLIAIGFSSLTLAISSLIHILEGNSNVGLVNRIRFYQYFILGIVWICCGLFKFELWTLTMGSIFEFFVVAYFLSKKCNINRINFSPNKCYYIWRKDIFFIQLKTAISWIGGFLLVGFLVQINFLLYGAETAGRFGMTFAFVSGIVALMSMFSLANQYNFGLLISKGRHAECRDLQRKLERQILIYSTTSFLLFYIFLNLLNYYDIYLGRRMLTPSEAAPYLFGAYVGTLTVPISVRIRAYKVEPFYILSLLSGLIFIGLIFIINKNNNFTSIGYIYMIIMIINSLIILILNKRYFVY